MAKSPYRVKSKPVAYFTEPPIGARPDAPRRVSSDDVSEVNEKESL
jgi:hypothetical protein